MPHARKNDPSSRDYYAFIFIISWLSPSSTLSPSSFLLPLLLLIYFYFLFTYFLPDAPPREVLAQNVADAGVLADQQRTIVFELLLGYGPQLLGHRDGGWLHNKVMAGLVSHTRHMLHLALHPPPKEKKERKKQERKKERKMKWKEKTTQNNNNNKKKKKKKKKKQAKRGKDEEGCKHNLKKKSQTRLFFPLQISISIIIISSFLSLSLSFFFFFFFLFLFFSPYKIDLGFGFA